MSPLTERQKNFSFRIQLYYWSGNLVEMRTGQKSFLEGFLLKEVTWRIVPDKDTFWQETLTIEISMFKSAPCFRGKKLSHIRSLVRSIERQAAVITAAAAEPSGHWTVKSRRVFHRLWETEQLETARGQRSHDSSWPYRTCGINAGLCCWP